MSDGSDRLCDMLEAQLKLQRELGNRIDAMDDEERIRYLKDNVIALISELNEFLGEIGWKPWASSRHINRFAAFGELRDAWQFLMNLMLATLDRSPSMIAAQLETELYLKHSVNRARHESGYDGIADKCPSCKRDLGEVTLIEIKHDDVLIIMCGGCQTHLDYDRVKHLLRD